MSAYTLKRFSRPEFLGSISPQILHDLLWPFREFFSQRGVPLPLKSANPRFEIHELIKALITPDIDTPKDLADALYYIHELATIEGMDALIDVITLERLGCGHLQREPADIAVRAWLVDRGALERTHAELFASHPRRFEYFQPRTRPATPWVSPTEEQLRPLEQKMDGEFERRNRGRGLRVFCFPHFHDCLFLVRHGDPYRREVTLHGDEPSSVLYRPLRFDIVAYDFKSCALRVHANSKWETDLYRNQFGLHLFGAFDHFLDGSRYTLDPLRRDGEASLACPQVRQIKFVALTEVQLRWGGIYEEVETRRAKNVFAALRKRRGQLPTPPKVTRATFDVHFVGQQAGRPLVICPPNVAHYARDEDHGVIDEWLSARGFIRNPLPEQIPNEQVTPFDPNRDSDAEESAA